MKIWLNPKVSIFAKFFLDNIKEIDAFILAVFLLTLT